MARENFQNKIKVTDNFETKLNKIILKLLEKNFSLVVYGKKIDTNGGGGGGGGGGLMTTFGDLGNYVNGFTCSPHEI